MKVLLAEDDLISCRTLEKDIKEWGYEVITAHNGKDAWNILKKEEIRLAILDWMMPEFEGVELCRKIRQDFQGEKSKYTYIILLTGRDEQKDIIKGISAGADDYMTKPFHFLELKVRLQKGERILALEDKRLELASYDELTKLWNRKKIFEFFGKELERGRREKHPTGVIMVDIDFFKNINDSHGHLAGDKVLVEVSDRLKNFIRSYDKIGRFGGDELLIILSNCTLAYLEKIGERLRRIICDRKIKVDSTSLVVSISLGGASSEGFPEATGEELISASDRALLSAKEQGRNRVILANLSIKGKSHFDEETIQSAREIKPPKSLP